MPSASWCFIKACLASMPPFRSDEMSRRTCFRGFDEMSVIRRFITSVKAIFSISRFDARRTNMMTSPVGGFRLKANRFFWMETTSMPIRSSALRISSSAYAFCSPSTILPEGCLILYLKIIRCSRSRSVNVWRSDSAVTFFWAAFLLGA